MRTLGRPTLLRNLVSGMPCRILVYIHYFENSHHFYATDNIENIKVTDVVALVGRTTGLRKIGIVSDQRISDQRVSIFGHFTRHKNFFIEEVEQ